MRRRIVLGFFMSILIASCSLIPAHAASVNLPAKSTLESAVAKIKSFADYSKYYGPNSTPITPSEPYYQEYEYLNSLATKTQILIDKYDDTAFTLRNAEAYNTALPAIDEAIAGCRYLFGIVRAEHLAQQAQTSTSSTTATTPASTPTLSVQQSDQTPSASSAPAQPATTSTTTQAPSSSDSTLATFTATNTSNTEQSSATHSDDNTPVEIPKTGGISQSSSILFIVIVSLVAALAATGIYCVYRRPAKHATPAARRKRR